MYVNFEKGGFDLNLIDPFGTQKVVDLKFMIKNKIDDETYNSHISHIQFTGRSHALVTFATGNIALFDENGRPIKLTY